LEHIPFFGQIAFAVALTGSKVILKHFITVFVIEINNLALAPIFLPAAATTDKPNKKYFFLSQKHDKDASITYIIANYKASFW
jgi:hypothetical protein